MTYNLRGDTDKIRRLEQLYSLCEARSSSFIDANGFFTSGFVFGNGDVSSKILLIGEAPGRDEVEAGIPFCGKAGKILDEFIQKTSCKRDDMFITNTVKYRLARLRKNAMPTLFGDYANSDMANRPATSKEISFAVDFLREEILILKPQIIVTLGNTPLKAVFMCFFADKGAPAVGSCHGTFFEIPGVSGSLLYPVYHPASLIYNPKAAPEYSQDLERLGSYIRNG